MICPCKDCEMKGCGAFHDKCEKYLKYIQWKKSVNEKDRKLKQFAYIKYVKK